MHEEIAQQRDRIYNATETIICKGFMCRLNMGMNEKQKTLPIK